MHDDETDDLHKHFCATRQVLFCSSYFCRTTKLIAWLGSEQPADISSIPGFSCQLQTLDLTHFPRRNTKATPLWHVLSSRLHSMTCLSYGNPLASRQSPAVQWVPSADCLTSEDLRGVTKKRGTGLWMSYGHQEFEISEGIFKSSRDTTTSTSPTTGLSQFSLFSQSLHGDRERRRAMRNSYHRSAGLRGHRTYSAGLNMRSFQLPEKFVSALHMMSRKVQKISLFWRERGRRTLMFKCLTRFFPALN